SPKEKKALVEVRIKYDHLFTGSKGNISKGWKVVIAKLGEDFNIFRDHEKKFQRKWATEVKKYKDQMEPSAHSSGIGTEDGDSIVDLTDEEQAIFEMLAKYHEQKHNINPPALFDTSMPSTSHDHNYSNRSYATSQSEYVSEEYLVSDLEVEVSSQNVDKDDKKDDNKDEEDVDDDEDEDVSVTAKGSKRCKDYYNKKTKKQKKEKKNKRMMTG
ncbi:Replicase polyprotein 1a, partial [Frankliniella fusca]